MLMTDVDKTHSAGRAPLRSPRLMQLLCGRLGILRSSFATLFVSSQVGDRDVGFLCRVERDCGNTDGDGEPKHPEISCRT